MASEKDLAKLTVQLELQAAAFEAGAKGMDRTLKRMEKNTNQSSKGFDKLNRTLGKVGISFGALAGALSVNALKAFTREAIAFGDSIDKVSSKVGVTAEELQELRFAASQSGVDVRQLDMGIQRFARRMGEAAKGTGELLKTTQALGIEFKNADGTNKSTVELLEQYAEAIGNASTQQEKLRLAFKAFDSEGAALVNLLDEGVGKLNSFREEARRLGLVMGEGTTAAAAKLNDELDKLDKIISTRANTAVIRFTASLANFFGLLDGEGQVALARSRIEQFTDVYRRAFEEGDNSAAEAAVVVIAKWSQTLFDLTQKYGTFARVVNTTTIDPKIDEKNKLSKFKSVIDEIAEAEDPFYKFIKQIEAVQEAMLAGAITKPQMDAAIQRIGEAAYYALDPLGQFEAKVNKFVEENNLIQNKADQLAVLYAAMQLFEDAGNFEAADALFEKIANLDGVSDAGDKMKEFGDITIESLKEIKDAVDGFARDFTDTLFDALETGELRFDEFAKNILKTIAKIILNKIFEQFFTAITNPLFGSLGLQSVDLGDEGLTASIAQSNQALTREGEASTQMMTVGRVQPQLKSASQSPVTVNVNNYGKDEVQVAERRDSNGGIEIDVLIKSTVRQGFANGDFDKVMQNTYGARRLGY